MGFWQKSFVDGSVVIGTDEDVQKGRASWRESRNEGMYSAAVGCNGKVVTIKGTGEYWQSDTFSTDFPNPSSTLLARRVMKKLLPMVDNYVRIFQSEKKLVISFSKELLTHAAPYLSPVILLTR